MFRNALEKIVPGGSFLLSTRFAITRHSATIFCAEFGAIHKSLHCAGKARLTKVDS
jgi:hypothetical protein